MNVDSAPLFLLQQNTYFNAVCFEWLQFVAFADSEFFFSLDMDVTSGLLHIVTHKSWIFLKKAPRNPSKNGPLLRSSDTEIDRARKFQTDRMWLEAGSGKDLTTWKISNLSQIFSKWMGMDEEYPESRHS